MNHYTNKENLSNIGIENILQRFSSFSSFKTHWVKKYLNYRELVYKTNLANLCFYKKMFLPFYLWFIFATGICICRSSRPEVFCVKGLLRNFTEFTGKRLCQSLFFNKVAGLRPAILLKKSLWHRSFPVNFAKFLITTFFTEHLWWLLLNIFSLSYPNLFPLVLWSPYNIRNLF